MWVGEPLSVLIAAGPFTTQDNLDYAPLTEILTKVQNTKPDVLILVGPFVDSSHPILATGDIVLDEKDDDDNIIGQHGASYETVFIEKIIRDGLQMMFNGQEDDSSTGFKGCGPIPTNIILVPSLLDAHHEFVFPQPPFGDRDEVNSNFFDEALGTILAIITFTSPIF
jgi:DNA polymerase alpha subunit B